MGRRLREESESHGALADRMHSNLGAFLTAIGRVCGESDTGDATRVRGATRWSSWTLQSFDRTLSIALLCPLLTMFVAWAMWGHTGQTERVLGLKSNISFDVRAAFLAIVILQSIALRIASGLENLSLQIILFMVSFGSILAIIDMRVIESSSVVIFGIGIAIGMRDMTTRATENIGVGGLRNICLLFAYYSSLSLISIGNFHAMYVQSALVVGLVSLTVYLFDKYKSIVFTKLYFFVFVTVSVIPFFLCTQISWIQVWPHAGPPLLILVVMTAISGSFAWLALGTTRALLRRGLELGAWRLSGLVLVNAVLSIFLTVLLSMAMIVNVQTFDQLEVHGGGRATLPLADLVGGIESHPGRPEFWWIYVLLVLPMIPSVLSLGVAGMSLLSGALGSPRWTQGRAPLDGSAPLREKIKTVLARRLTYTTGTTLGLGVQFLLAVSIVAFMFPLFGLDVFSMAQGTIEANIPEKILSDF